MKYQVKITLIDDNDDPEMHREGVYENPTQAMMQVGLIIIEMQRRVNEKALEEFRASVEDDIPF